MNRVTLKGTIHPTYPVVPNLRTVIFQWNANKEFLNYCHNAFCHKLHFLVTIGCQDPKKTRKAPLNEPILLVHYIPSLLVPYNSFEKPK